MNERRSSEVDMALLAQELAHLKDSVESLEGQVHGLLEAWNTATGVVKFVKYLAAITTAVGILWVAFGDLLKSHLR